MKNFAGQRVLIADGNGSIRALLARVFKLSGVLVDEASCSQEALGLLGNPCKQYALAIIDLRLPGLGGREISETLRRDRPSVSVLMLDSTGEERLDGRECLAKPFALAALKARISSLSQGRLLAAS